MANLEYLSIDLVSPLAMRRMDITNLQFPDGSFDVIFCNHVFEHVADDRRAMGEVCRVLSAGGWAILQTPIDFGRAVTDEDPGVSDPEERLRRFGQADHVRVYGRDVFQRLADAGWKMSRIQPGTLLTEPEIRLHAIDPEEPLLLGSRA